MKKNISFQTKITMLIIVLILVSIGMSILFVGKWSLDNIQNKVEDNIKNISVILANSPDIQNALKEKDFTKIQSSTHELLDELDGVDIITIADMNGIRYAHPNPDKIGKRFVGGDEVKVINEGVGYISQAKGTLGISIRAFEPIFYKKEQIGFVMVGVLYEDIKEFREDALITICGFTLFGIILGIIGALIIAKKTKDSLLGLEPYEIVYLYKENRAMLESIIEGIIAIDSKGRITLVNDYAIKILNIKKPNVIGEYVLDVFPTSRLLEVLKSGECEYNEEQIINDTVILTNRVPMKDGDKIIGAMASFNDRTKVKRLAEEITGVTQIIQALRANTHEFMNKLHVILGLVKLNEIDELRIYIKDIVKEQEQIRFFLTKNIKNPTISAIILGKLNRAKELNVDMELCENCYLEKYYKNIQNENLLTIIGNLLDNAMEAIVRKGEDGEVYFRIEDVDDFIEIEVHDNGIGIEDENIERIFRRGFTTKEGEGGIGLFLVKKSINQLNGELLIDSKYKEGTSILVRIPKEEKG
ncbi:ATP-binding protein [Tepidibacter aestuarii]|uniref:ATP-binding protein n=1 Tax=Tepidibacter aestuarii TaxID=2925782 RepID=UPI0020BE9F2B|nr:sensor histidine kinase [Tepidibacter aestuarii]CAH2212118.1 Two-component sensor histidine kinase, malate [Tepidibacter aestuarii]